ncbi:extracellular solute-binding protein [Caproiciproducens galactitolivorans]|uniref:Maltodextrin-binding protein n=1 Tax=Caproiciproducens galactitolivorans TaxID=642589 RepID=A0ABT4BRF0_9FIRM|nr:extracellular solute-binding protein [Caproiciproducens galactitolivorans]MCY1713479.1 extracellular solute-binding protein [Caproiciproducens galactitolivorans]
MKKVFAFFMSVLFMLGALTGCQQSSGASPSANPSGASTSNAEKKEPVSLTIWYENDQKIGDALQQQLDKLPDVKVKVQRKDKMTDALKLVGNDPQSAPDLFFFAHDKTGLYAEMGILAPITDFISQDAFSDFIPMTLKAGTYKDTLYQLPIYFETQMFMYNKKLMSTPPKTTDDLLKFAQKNTKNGAYGFVEQHSTAYYAVSWMHAFGGYIIDKDAQPGLNLQGTVDSLKYHKPFIKYQPADGDYNTMTALFKEGKAASTINLPNLAVDAKQSGIDVGFAPLPVVNATGKPLSPYAGVQGVYVLKSSESGKKDAIAAVLQELAKPEAGIALSKITNDAPANNKAYADSFVSSNEIVMNLKGSADAVVPMPNVPAMDVMWSVTENMLSAVNKKDGDPKAEAEKAQKTALTQIADMK